MLNSISILFIGNGSNLDFIRSINDEIEKCFFSYIGIVGIGRFGSSSNELFDQNR